jgi:hypothetical protein
VAAIVKDRVARVATSRARDLTRVRVAIRTAGPIRGDVSIKARDPIRRFGEIRTAALIKRGDSTSAHAVTKAARIRVDDSNRGRATKRAGALIKTVGRTKALCATISGTALQRVLVPTLMATPPVVGIDQIAIVENVVAAVDAVAAGAVVAAEAKAEIARVHPKAEHP